MWCCVSVRSETNSVSEPASSLPWSTALPLTGSTPGLLRHWSVWPPASWWTFLPLTQTPVRTLLTTCPLHISLWQRHPACTWRACADTTTPHQRSACSHYHSSQYLCSRSIHGCCVTLGLPVCLNQIHFTLQCVTEQNCNVLVCFLDSKLSDECRLLISNCACVEARPL